MNKNNYAVLAVLLVAAPLALAWNNGQSGHSTTETAADCANPPYATHDWIPDHALALLPANEAAWLVPHKNLLLLGTEAPDHKGIPTQCGAPNTGYDDRSSGHSVEWKTDGSDFAKDGSGHLKDRAARRAQEEYGKAVIAFQQGKPGDAAYYLGAMAHYIGDVSQYGHSVPSEQHHGDYETWVAGQTARFDGGTYESAIHAGTLVRRTAYTAAKRISRTAFKGDGDILSAQQMDAMFPNRETNPAFRKSVGASLNLAVNETADVLHTFFLNVVDEN